MHKLIFFIIVTYDLRVAWIYEFMNIIKNLSLHI